MKNSRNQHCSVKKECKMIKFLGVANNEEHRPKFLILNVQSTCSNQQYVKEILICICTDIAVINRKCYKVKMYHKKSYKTIAWVKPTCNYCSLVLTNDVMVSKSSHCVLGWLISTPLSYVATILCTQVKRVGNWIFKVKYASKTYKLKFLYCSAVVGGDDS